MSEMTDAFACADACREAGESPIGMAGAYDYYVLVECPPPWPAQAPQAKPVPEALRALMGELKETVRFLFVHSEAHKQSGASRALFLRRPADRARAYHKSEATVRDLSEVTPLVRAYLAGESLPQLQDSQAIRDILVCTHGTHDKCCGRYGNPFYQQACQIAAHRQDVRLWKSSHFGGHRFAPTAIDFPDGRHYGFLDGEAFAAILARSGDIRYLDRVYRGSGLLPRPLQFLEKELALSYGWDWFSYKINGRVLEEKIDGTHQYLELIYEMPNGKLGGYRAEALLDENKTVSVYGNCDSRRMARFPKLAIRNWKAIQTTVDSSQVSHGANQIGLDTAFRCPHYQHVFVTFLAEEGKHKICCGRTEIKLKGIPRTFLDKVLDSERFSGQDAWNWLPDYDWASEVRQLLSYLVHKEIIIIDRLSVI